MRSEFVVPGLEEIRGNCAQEIYYEIICIFIMRRRIKLSASPRVGTLLYTITCNYPNLCHVLQFSMLSYKT